MTGRRRAIDNGGGDDDELFCHNDGERDYQQVNIKRKKLDEEEEEDYSSDYDYDEEDSRKRKRRSTIKAYIDDIADVADSDEDLDDEGEGEAEDGFIDDNVAELQKGCDRRMPRRPFLPKEDYQDDVEEIERIIEQKYGSLSCSDQFDEGYGEETTFFEQQALLPSVRDPKLWMVKCEIGHEREAAVRLMQKSIDIPELQISSAIALDNLKNYIYIEAHKEAHVREACKGLRHINSKKMMVVPIKEMAAVLSIKSKPIDISKDTWIRMKIGKYKGDLAKVTDVDDIRQRVTVKLVPRIELQELADRLAGVEVVKKAYVPPPKLINTREVRENNIQTKLKRDPFTGEYFVKIAGLMFKDGYLYKSVSMKSISYHDIQPTFDELERFLPPREDDDGDFSSYLLTEDTKKAHFLKGDKIVVVKGDLMNMRGIIEKVDEECVCIRPEIKDLPEALMLNVKDISKYFETGDHVTVVSGTQEGATGIVTKVEGHILFIVSDASMEEIRVLADNVIKSSEVTSTANRNKDYQLHDLVLLNDASFGIIVGGGSKTYHMLKGIPQRSEIQVIKYQDINSKIEKMGTAEDKFRNRISVKDVGRIIEGPFKGNQGPIEHIYKQIVFIKDRNKLEHGGFICVKAQSCTLLGGSFARGGVKDDNVGLNISGLRSSPCTPQSLGRSLIRGGPLRERTYQSGRRAHDSIVGTRVKICKGHYKGSQGRVIDVRGQSVRVELESQMRIVTVDRSQISDKMNVTTQNCDPSQYGLGSDTPMRVNDSTGEPGTPFHCGMRTPVRSWAWNPYASMSPARDRFGPAASELDRAASPGSSWTSRNCSVPGIPIDGSRSSSSNSDITQGNTSNLMRNPQLLLGTP